MSLKDFVEVGELHFDAVLVRVDAVRHAAEGAGLHEGGIGRGVDDQGPEGRLVGVGRGEGAGVEVVVVGGAEDEDSLSGDASVSLTVLGDCSGLGEGGSGFAQRLLGWYALKQDANLHFRYIQRLKRIRGRRPRI